MKKTVCLIILLILVISLSSCSSSHEFNILEVSGYDNYSEAKHHNDIELSSETYQKPFMSKKNITVNGKNFSGNYSRTIKHYLFNSEIDYYEYSENGTMYQFGLNAKTGEVDIFSYMDVNYSTLNSESVLLTENQCASIALQYLCQYVDTDKYTLMDTKYWESPEYGATYNFKFVLLVDGIRTSDTAVIGVTVYGDVISHMFRTLNEFENFNNSPSDKEYELIDEKIDAKIKDIYNSVLDKYDYTRRDTEKMFVKLSDGKYALEYYISVLLIPKNPLAKDHIETIKFIVYIE